MSDCLLSWYKTNWPNRCYRTIGVENRKSVTSLTSNVICCMFTVVNSIGSVPKKSNKLAIVNDDVDTKQFDLACRQSTAVPSILVAV